MSKKNKKKDYWDIDPVEQASILDKYYEAETSDKNVMDLLGGDPLLNETGIPSSLEKSIVKSLTSAANPEVEEDFWNTNSMSMTDALDKEEEDTEDDDMTVSEFLKMLDPDSDEEEGDREEDGVAVPNTESTEVTEGTPDTHWKNIKIQYDLYPILHRLVLDDHIAPTAFSFDIAATQDIIGVYDADDIEDKLSLLDLYILSLKHPTAVYLKNEFIDEYGCVEDFNDDKFVFMNVDNYVLAYAIDLNTKNDFIRYIGDLTKDDPDPNIILKIYVSLAFACGTMQEAFFVEEDEYLRYFINSEYNRRNKFKALFFNDNDTVMSFTGDNEDTFKDIISVESLQKLARNAISAITGEEYFDEDEIEDLLADEAAEEPEPAEAGTMKVASGTALADKIADELPKKEEEPEKVEEVKEEEIVEAESTEDIQINIAADDDSDTLPEIPVQHK